MMRAAAFCPGHITGFFEICRSKDVMSTGSRGAGLCIALGAGSVVRVGEAKRQSVSVSINGRASAANVTKRAIEHLVGGDKLKTSVSTSLDLPMSQGFGMSAAGSLSAALATAHILGLT